jgi:2-polyprenyl-3-methyl-5-hydroxy-6-metoxy-1,4-benzoquinol methylase
MDLKQRVLAGELMDGLDLEPTRHRVALRGLERVNRLSRTANVISKAIRAHCNKGRGRPLRILDLACGGGDVTLAVSQRLLAAGMPVAVEGWDRSETAISYAAQRSTQRITNRYGTSTRHVRFYQHDVLDLDREGEFDVVMCTLFMHHLPTESVVQLLTKMHRAARQLVLVDDLRRTMIGYRMAQLGCRLLTRSPIVHADGPLSVRAAFTESELRELSQQAQLPEPHITRHWPQRFLMTWKLAS